MKKDITDPRILLAGNTQYFQSNKYDYEVAEYSLDSDVSELRINASGAAYILPSGVKIVIPNEISCDVDKIYCSVAKESKTFQLNPTDQLLSSIVELTPKGSEFAKPLQISIPYHYTTCDKQMREIVMRVTTACTNGFLKYEDLNSELINRVEEDANSFSGEVVSFVNHFSLFGVIARLKEDHVVVENEQTTDLVSSVDSSTKLLFPRSSVVNPTDVTITVLKIDDADVKNIVMCDHCPVSNVLQVSVSPKNTVFRKPVTVFLALPKSLLGKSYDKKMLRLLKSSSKSEHWQDITTEVELQYKAENVSFQVDSFSNFCLVGKDLEIDDLPKVIRRTITYEVQFLAMQRKPCPSLVLAQCVRRDLVKERINQLYEEKYFGDDPYTAVHDFVEGQRFKVKVVGGIKVKSNDKDEKKLIEEKILVKQFHSQCAPDASGFSKFHIEPSKVALKTSTGYITFNKVLETKCFAHESNGICKTGNVCVEKHLPENDLYIDSVPITLESAAELSEVAKPEPETDIFTKLSCELASEIGEEWQEIATHLGMKKCDLDRYRNDYPNHMKNQISTMLCEWSRMHAEDSEWCAKLVKALKNTRRNDLAKRVEDMYIEEKKRLETQ